MPDAAKSAPKSAGTENLTVEQIGHTLVVTMNRPEAKNALSPAMLVGMADAWVRIDEDDDIRILGVLVGVVRKC